MMNVGRRFNTLSLPIFSLASHFLDHVAIYPYGCGLEPYDCGLESKFPLTIPEPFLGRVATYGL
jgi:hypothetical protein